MKPIAHRALKEKRKSAVTKIIISDPNYGPRANEISRLVKQSYEWVVVPPSDRQRLLVEIREADVVVTSHFDAEMGKAARQLRLVQCTASGTDGINLSALREGVVFCNTYHHEQSIAEHVLMSMLALSRDLLGADRDLRRGHWRSVVYEDNFRPHRLLAGKTVGIIGYGHIGQRIAVLAKAFAMRVIAVRRDPSKMSPNVDEIRSPSELGWLMRSSDFAVVALPLTEETRGSIGKEQLVELGSQGFLINVGRGPIIDEAALYRALTEGTIAGAAIDVWYQYPDAKGSLQLPSRYDFASLSNVIMTPHHSGQANENFSKRIEDFAFNINSLENGAIFRNRLI